MEHILSLFRPLPKIQDQQRLTYQTLLNAVSDLGNGVAVADDKAKLVVVNEAFCKIVGYTFEELLNIPSTWALIPPEDLSIIQTQFQQRLEVYFKKRFGTDRGWHATRSWRDHLFHSR